MKLEIGYNEAILYTSMDEGTTDEGVTTFYVGNYIYDKMVDMNNKGLRVSASIKMEVGSWLSDLGWNSGGYLNNLDGSVIITVN